MDVVAMRRAAQGTLTPPAVGPAAQHQPEGRRGPDGARALSVPGHTLANVTMTKDSETETGTKAGTGMETNAEAGTVSTGGPAQVAWTVLDTPIGPLLLAASGQGLVQVAFHADEATVPSCLERLAGRLGAVVAEAPGQPHLAEAIRQLREYFEGDRREFALALDWSLTTGFNRQVQQQLADTVPYGTVVAYHYLADRVGEPGAARAVGVAMGANPLPVVVPCHRVVESGGGIGGFGGGLAIKRFLLALEGVLPEPLF
jgi:methylated-DNA-[protein]-cysteine S-methyltransferase